MFDKSLYDNMLLEIKVVRGKACAMLDFPSQRLDPKIKSVWRISDTVWIAIVYLCCAFPFLLIGAIDPAETWAFFIFICFTILFAALLIIFVVVLPPVRYARWRYELTKDYLDIAKGIIWRKRYIIPFIRVQNTDTKQGPVLRAFKLASVTVSTAAGSHEIPGLDNALADEVRDRAAEFARLAREDV